MITHLAVGASCFIAGQLVFPLSAWVAWKILAKRLLDRRRGKK